MDGDDGDDELRAILNEDTENAGDSLPGIAMLASALRARQASRICTFAVSAFSHSFNQPAPSPHARTGGSFNLTR